MANEHVTQMLRTRFVRYKELADKVGATQALEEMLPREAEREKRQMGPLIANSRLAPALERAIPVFQQMGMVMSVVDISNGDKDAVLEIHKVCPYAALAKEFGVDRPCDMTCALDIRAVTTAFPDMHGRLLSSMADGDCVCVFKYERKQA